MKNSNVASIALFLCLISPVYISAEVFSVLALISVLVVLFFSRARVHKSILICVSPIVFLAFSGLHGYFDHDTVSFFRDVWYTSKILPFIFLGYLLAQFLRVVTIFKIIVAAGVVSALVHLSYVFTGGGIGGALKEVRYIAGSGYIMTVFSSVVLLVSLVRKIPLFGNSRYLIILLFLITLVSLYYSFSRTWLGMYAILTLVMFGYWGRSNFRSLSVTVLGMFFISFVFIGYEAVGGQEVTFLDKLKGSLDEIRLIEYDSPEEINTHFRGHEARRAFDSFLSGDIIEKIFGRGFGEYIDLGYVARLGVNRIETNLVPITHNIYPSILLKTGILGLVLYFWFCLNLIRSASQTRDNSTLSTFLSSRMLVGIAWASVMSGFLISGLYNKTALMPLYIMIGAFLYSNLMENSKHSRI